jgi:hypothetical protein
MLQVGMLFLLMTMYPSAPGPAQPSSARGDPLPIPPPPATTVCQETPIAASPWQNMQRRSDAVLCTTTFVPQ